MKEKIPIVKGEWHEVIVYQFYAECPKCKYWFNEIDVDHYDGERFVKTLNCPECGTCIKIKTNGGENER